MKTRYQRGDASRGRRARFVGRSMFAVLSCAALCATGCTGRGDAVAVDDHVWPGSIAPTTAAPTTTEAAPPAVVTTPLPPSPASPLARELGAVIRGMFATRDMASAAPHPDPDSPLLGTYAAGDVLAELRDAIRDRRDHGVARRSSAAHLSMIAVGAVTTDGSAAYADACQIDDDVLFDMATGDIVDDSVVTRSLDARFEPINGIWKLVGLALNMEWDGVAGCAQSMADYHH